MSRREKSYGPDGYDTPRDLTPRETFADSAMLKLMDYIGDCSVRPTPREIADKAVSYADALVDALRDGPDPHARFPMGRAIPDLTFDDVKG